MQEGAGHGMLPAAEAHLVHRGADRLGEVEIIEGGRIGASIYRGLVHLIIDRCSFMPASLHPMTAYSMHAAKSMHSTGQPQ